MSASAQSPSGPLPELLNLPDGPHCDTLAVGAHGDYVILTFPVPVSWVALDPETAKHVGETVARCGYAVESREDVYGKKPIIIEQIRQRLLVAVEHLLKSEIINERLDPHMTAQRCVELMLTEAT